VGFARESKRYKTERREKFFKSSLILFNMENITLETIHNDLNNLKNLVLNIQETLDDSFLTTEEENLLEKSYENEKKGLLISSEDLEKELSL
jgi:hypothetical protein